MAGLKHPVTPDGRYFVVRGRLWRLANPDLSSEARCALVSELMAARSAVRSATAILCTAMAGRSVSAMAKI
jgi:hypothetical protein